MFEIIAHRGYARLYPENTLASIQAAINLGIRWIEVDCQFTADSIPILMHDDTLTRTSGQSFNVTDLTWQQVKSISVHEPARLGNQFLPTLIPTLSALLEILPANPNCTILLELKEESIAKFGIPHLYETLAAQLAPFSSQLVIISYNLLILRKFSEHNLFRIGWVLQDWDSDWLHQATELAPNLIICNHKKLPNYTEHLPKGCWQWAFYEVEDLPTAHALNTIGAHFMETMSIEQLLTDEHK